MKYTINAGELDRRLTIQQPSGTQDEYGQTPNSWVDVYVDISCGVNYIKGGEVWESTQDVGNLTTDFKIRYVPITITPRMRVVFEGEHYDIKRVVEITRRKGFVIQAKWKDNR
jgi:SPP1 family predicted phage head-tail adaptor